MCGKPDDLPKHFESTGFDNTSCDKFGIATIWEIMAMEFRFMCILATNFRII